MIFVEISNATSDYNFLELVQEVILLLPRTAFVKSVKLSMTAWPVATVAVDADWPSDAWDIVNKATEDANNRVGFSIPYEVRVV